MILKADDFNPGSNAGDRPGIDQIESAFDKNRLSPVKGTMSATVQSVIRSQAFF
jgi:hypothetical protein